MPRLARRGQEKSAENIHVLEHMSRMRHLSHNAAIEQTRDGHTQDSPLIAAFPAHLSAADIAMCDAEMSARTR